MKTQLKLSAYGAALALLVAGAYVVGTAVGPMSEQLPRRRQRPGRAPATVTARPRPRTSPAASPRRSDGYTLVPESTTLGSGTFAFRITGPDGAAVTAFDVEHDKRLHLIVVRRDATGFQHVHPEMAADGHLERAAHRRRRRRVPGVRRLHPHRRPGDHPRRRPVRARRLPAGRRTRRPARPPSTATPSRSTATSRPAPSPRSRSPSAATARPSPTCSPTSARTATSWRCATATSPTCTCTPRTDDRARARGRVRRRGAQRGHLPAVPRLPARRRGAHRRVHAWRRRGMDPARATRSPRSSSRSAA